MEHDTFNEVCVAASIALISQTGKVMKTTLAAAFAVCFAGVEGKTLTRFAYSLIALPRLTHLGDT
jgi:hypothetical protein